MLQFCYSLTIFLHRMTFFAWTKRKKCMIILSIKRRNIHKKRITKQKKAKRENFDDNKKKKKSLKTRQKEKKETQVSLNDENSIQKMFIKKGTTKEKKKSVIT